MKKLIFAFLLSIPLFSFGQILINPNSSINTARYNAAVMGSVAVSGTNSYTLNYLNTGDPATGITTYTGFALNVTFTNPNSTSSTFNLNGLGVKTMKKYSAGVLSDLALGDIGVGERKRIWYDGTYIVIEGGSGGGGGVSDWGDIEGTLSDQTDLQAVLDLKALKYPATRTVTSSTTLLLSDAGNAVEMNSASATTITVPPQASVTWVADTYVTLLQSNTGKFTVTEGVGVSFKNSAGNLESTGEGSLVVLKRTATSNVWYVFNGNAGGVATVTGTPGQINSSGGTNPAISISASYAGQTSITTLGTISTGAIPGTLITLTDVTTNNATTSAHGFLKKLSNSSSDYMDGTGNWSNPSAGTAWLLTGTSTLSGLATITSNAANQHIYTGTWTATANSQYHSRYNPTITARSTSADVIDAAQYYPTINLNGTAQVANAFHILPTFSGGSAGHIYNSFRITSGASSNVHTAIRIEDSSLANLFTITNDGTITGKSGSNFSMGNGQVIFTTLGLGNNNSSLQVNLPTGAASVGMLVRGNAGGSVTDTQDVLRVTSGITTVAGTPTFAAVAAKPIINISGGTGTVYGFNYEPTLTNVAGVTSHLAFRATAGSALLSNGNLTLGTAGNKLLIKEGTNAAAGVVTLVAGTATVSNTIVTANSRIKLTAQNLGTITVPAAHAISARVASTSFTILSSDLTDTSIIYWEIMEPAP